MKFLANENIPFTVVKELRKLGYDIIRIDEIKKGMKDEEVIEVSLKEGRIIITFNKDFGELIIKKKRKVKGIIFLRIAPESIDFIKEKVIAVIEKFTEIEGKFLIVQKDKVRERLLENF